MSPPSPSALQQLSRLNRSLPGFHDRLSDILYGEGYQKCVPNLQGDDSAWLVDYLDEALNTLEPSSPAFRKCLRELRRICGTKGILPTSYTLSSRLLNVGPVPFASGGYGDVYEGTLDGSRVCIKRVRVYAQDGPQTAAKTFCKEAVTWKRLTHPNILPLLGVTIAPLQLISSWMSGGDLLEYTKKNRGADRLGLVSDVAKGLWYLHSCNVIHGGLMGPNIFVDNSGNARITDFGLATITQNPDSTRSTSLQHGHTPRWTAPEILSEQGSYSKEADVFSFAMVMIEVFTGAIPFSNGPSVAAISAITQGRRPPRPTHPSFTEDLWVLTQRCWDQEPHLRPEVSETLQILLTSKRPTWKRLISDTLTTDECISLITTIFSDSHEVNMVGHLSGDDAQAFVDIVDEALDSLPSRIRRKCLFSLYKICGRQALLPKSLEIPLCYNPTDIPQCHGRSADVWKGQHQGLEVAAKVLRVYLTSDFERIRKRFCVELVTWKALRHPNVLPLLGVTMTETRFVMVSEWMVNGNISEFVKTDIEADRLGLLGDVTRGLSYMHDQGIVHGNLKGANILINHNGHACLADFSLLTIASNQATVISSSMEGGAVQWMSPELIDPESFGLEKVRPTKESDCYALGMVVYEVLSGRTPFDPWTTALVIRKVLEGQRPGRPQGEGGVLFTDGIWRILELCWRQNPDERTSAKAVLPWLKGTPPYPDVAETDIDGQSDATTSDSSPSITRGVNGLPYRPRSPRTTIKGSKRSSMKYEKGLLHGYPKAKRIGRLLRNALKRLIRKPCGL